MTTTTRQVPRLALFPRDAGINTAGHLTIGACDTYDLAKEFGTPLYVFDEAMLRHQCREFVKRFGGRYPDAAVCYASKAFLTRAMAKLVMEEGLGLDVVSIGEFAIAHSVDFPPERVYFHGNNKGPEELAQALDWGIGRIVVDSMHELKLLNEIARERNISQDILLRLTPNVDPHTHEFTTTGVLDSKFGIPVSTGQAEEAVVQAMRLGSVNLLGLHFHLGSPIPETAPFEAALRIVLEFAREMKRKYDFDMVELNIGGGFPVAYTLEDNPPPIAVYSDAIVSTMSNLLLEQSMLPPRLTVEPGRAIVAQAGVALYTVGVIKEIPGVRKFVCVDGGMSDNIRPPLYGAKYEALVANKAGEQDVHTVTIAGKLCESSDVLVKDIQLARIAPGDVIAVPVCGAYCVPMSSNYNAMPRPAIVFVNRGNARVVRRRETNEDLYGLDEL
ncbi:MAG: diaminopimelate decarboxylase [Chloroflexi bacterium]|nr:diaminopimelate decarboxylase [Chloroflexota bacterium]